MLRRPFHKIALWFFKPDTTVVDKIRPLPPCWTPDIKKGGLYQQGIFKWCGHTVTTDDSPFMYPKNTPTAWVAYAHSFEWLLHIQSTAGFTKCMQWIINWHHTYGSDFSSPIWHVDTTAPRLCTWLSHYDALMIDISYEDRKVFHHIIGTHYRYLEYAYTNTFVPMAPVSYIQQLHMLQGIICAGLSLQDGTLNIPPLMDKFLLILDTIMDTDGLIQGHLPTHIKVLKMCLYLRSSLHKMKAGTPEVLDPYVDKMWRVVRFFYNVLGDFSHMAGTTALNHQYQPIKCLCKNERSIVPSLQNSQYFMQKTDGFTIYLDAMPRMGQPTDTGGLLAITLAYDKHPVCVACGYTPQMGVVCQYSAAHNTLSINNTNSVPVNALQSEKQTKTYTPCMVTIKEQAIGDWIVWQSAHMGYESTFGVKIERKIGIHTNGHIISGQDSVVFMNDFSLAQPMNIAIRFHLHPHIKPMILESGQVILTSNKTSPVTFEAKNCDIFIENSYYIDENHTRKPTQQIVLKQTYTPEILGEKQTHIEWTFRLNKG